MASVTGLQLVNRVLAFRRKAAVSAYAATNPEHFVILNALNMAKENILGTRRWEFDLRHDGQLVTKASTLSRSIASTITTTAGSAIASIELPTLTAADEIAGDWVARIVPTENSDYSETAFRVLRGAFVTTTATVTLPVNVPVSIAAGEADVFWCEYLLPDTVQEVVRASYEQTGLSLEQLDPTVEFDELIPSPRREKGEPRVLSIGGFDIGTYDSSGSAPAPKLRAIVWPVPDDEYVITYSYYRRHPDLENGDSTLDGIPPSIVNDIVTEAIAMTKMAIDGDYAAAHFSDMAQSQAAAKHSAYSGSSGRRHTIRSWDSGRTSNLFAGEGFPGRLIGQ